MEGRLPADTRAMAIESTSRAGPARAAPGSATSQGMWGELLQAGAETVLGRAGVTLDQPVAPR